MTGRLLLNRLLALLRGGRLDRELDDEIAAHLELAERDALAAGLSPDEARRAARRAFGGIDQMKEEHRDRRSVRWLQTLLRDVRYGTAALGRDAGFTTVVLGLLAIGIGANAAMFSLVDAVLLRPVPFPGPDRIVRVWEAPRPGAMNATSTLDFLDWQRLATSFEALAAEMPAAVALTGAGEAVRLDGKAVTPGYFTVFATGARLGRTFRPEDAGVRAARVVVLSHGAWQTYFGGAPDILQQHPILDGEAHQVIGVLPPGAFDRNAELWIPLAFGPDVQRRDRHWLSVSGRLRSGVTLAQAREEMAAIDTALADTMPLFKRDWTIVVEPLESVLVGDTVRHSVLLLFGAVVIVLLIACANVANLLLARGATRAKEMAVRAALGAGRGRLVVQLLTETAVLCLCGAAAGLGLAHLLLESAVPLLSDSLPYTAGVRLDGRVLGFTAIAALAVTLIVGVLPSLRASIVDVSAVLNGSARGSSSPRSALRRGIVIAEVALSLILVCAALLLFRSLHNLHGLETGVRVENIMTMSIDLPAREHPTPDSAALRYDSLVERIGAAPGVEAVALTTHLPLRWIGNGEAIQVRGVEAPMPVRFKRVDAGYFSAFDIPVVNGRGFTGRDRAGAARVVVINEALAGRLREAGIADPVGEAVLLHYPDWQNQPWQGDVQIVGVIRSERVGAPWRPDPPVVYAPLAQVPQLGVLIAVRTAGKPAPVMPAIREAVRQVAPHLPIGDVASMREIRDRTFSGISRPAWLIGAFAAMAALLAALGLYGVVAHAVAQGRREIGIRLALGATPRGVLLHVLKNAMALVAIGLSVGLAGAFAATRLMAGFLFQVSPADPLTFAAAAASLVGVGLLAGLVPASRAAGVHPDAVLRDDG